METEENPLAVLPLPLSPPLHICGEGEIGGEVTRFKIKKAKCKIADQNSKLEFGNY
jgi:hypothetical protein